jgi:16S rRNA (guanine527-N7)-methyltransferase
MSQDRAEFERLLSSVLGQLVLKLDSDQVDILYKHYDLLSQWNKRINLTAIKDVETVVFRHFGESLAVGKVIGPGSGAVVDIGSGGGFPGVPVAVCWPERRVTLVESVGKKAVFLKEIARMLPNLSVFAGRLEDFEGRAEWATMRGVAIDGMEKQIGRVAQKVALVISLTKVSEATRNLRLVDIQRSYIPWDRRMMILAGKFVPRGTETSSVSNVAP